MCYTLYEMATESLSIGEEEFQRLQVRIVLFTQNGSLGMCITLQYVVGIN